MPIRPLGVALIVCFLASPGFSQSVKEQVRLTVQTNDDANLAVPGARVSIRNAFTGVELAEETTGPDGACVFEKLPPGRFLVSAVRSGFRDASVVQNIKSNGPVYIVSLRLGIGPHSEQVTVFSPSRLEEARDESPVKVDVVSRAQILDTGFVRLSDVLAEIPGVITQTGSAVQSGEQINGISSTEVAVLRDGLPIVGARGIKRGLINLNQQPTDRIEQVEVVKGAASTMYGSDAIGGVVNQITRQATHPLEADADVMGGSLGSVDAGGSAGAQFGNWDFFLSGSHQQMDSFRLIPGSPNTVGPDTSYNAGFAKLGYTFGPRARLSFTADGYHNHSIGEDFTEAGLARATNNASTQSYALMGNFVLSRTTTLQARAYAALYDESALEVGPDPARPAVSGNLNERYHRLDATISQQVGSWQILQGGVEWAQDQYKGQNRLVGGNTGQQVTATDYWLQDRLQLGSRTTLTLGGRATDNSMFGSAFVPKAGIVVKLTSRLLLRGSFGRGFRAPTVGELYYQFLHPESGYQVIGNPNLHPETSRSFSAGATYHFDRARITLDLFRNDVHHLIEDGVAGFPQTEADLARLFKIYNIPPTYQALPGLFTFLKLNVDRIHTEGLEAGAEVSPFRNLMLRAAYTYLQALDERTGQFLSMRFRHQGSFQGSYSSRKTGVTMNLRGTFFSSAPILPLEGGPAATEFGYGLWNLYASKSIRGGFQFFGALDNLFNSTDQNLLLPDPTYYRADYGRTWRLGMRWQWARE